MDVDRLTRISAIKIPDIDLTVMGAGIDVAAIGGAGWAEVAPDERFEDTVAAEGYERAVVGVRLVVFGVVGGEAVVEVGCVVLQTLLVLS